MDSNPVADSENAPGSKHARVSRGNGQRLPRRPGNSGASRASYCCCGTLCDFSPLGQFLHLG